MKNVLSVVLLLALGAVMAGCSSTTDKGVNISRPMDVFGQTPVMAAPATANPAPALLTDAQS